MQSLTPERARYLLSSLPIVRVRTFRKDKGQHAGRAILIRLEGKSSAVIKPHAHQKEEVVPLSTISEWKGGNSFHAERSGMSLAELAGGLGETAPPLSIGLPQPPKVEEKRYIIINPANKSAYGGPATRWVKNPHLAAAYTEPGHAGRALGQLKMQPDAREAAYYERSEAIRIMGTWAAISPSQGQNGNPVSDNLTGHPAPAPEFDDDAIQGLLALNVDDMERDDGDKLLKALRARATAAKNFKAAREIMISAYRDLMTAQKAYQDIMQGVAGAVVSQQHGPKRGMVRETVMQFVAEHDKQMTIGQMIDALQAVGLSKGAQNQRTSIRQAIDSLRKNGRLATMPNGTISLGHTTPQPT